MSPEKIENINEMTVDRKGREDKKEKEVRHGEENEIGAIRRIKIPKESTRSS